MERKDGIALGMSGGVDSAVSAALLLRAGYRVVGVTCLFLDNEGSRKAAEDAAAVCSLLGIPHRARDCAQLFSSRVIEPFVAGYGSGTTPSPCVGCNAYCKIPALAEAADELGLPKVATGHYARIAQLSKNQRYVVKAALDTGKDQSYMLSRLDQAQLARLVLPLGAMTKAEVRILAEDLGLPIAQKPESQDICFIDGDYADFLVGQGVPDEPGDIVDAQGARLGRHEGLFRYTIGQRKGIGVAAAEPYYVIGKDAAANELVVGFKDEALIDEVEVSGLNWQAFEGLEGPLDCMVRLRYRGRPCACTVEPCGDTVLVRLCSPQATTAPGQFAVFYEGETVLGGGVIEAVR